MATLLSTDTAKYNYHAHIQSLPQGGDTKSIVFYDEEYLNVAATDCSATGLNNRWIHKLSFGYIVVISVLLFNSFYENVYHINSTGLSREVLLPLFSLQLPS